MSLPEYGSGRIPFPYLPRISISRFDVMQISLRQAFYAIIFIALFLIPPAASADSWRLHPGADLATGFWPGETARIYDTPGRTWFVVRGRMFNTAREGFSEPFSSLMVYDKARPEGGIVPATDILDIPAGNVAFAEYSAASGILAVAYADGSLSLIAADGEVASTQILSDLFSVGFTKLWSMSFSADGSLLYLPTNFGWICIDARTGGYVSHGDIGAPLRHALPLGDLMVVADEKTLYAIPGDATGALDLARYKVALPSSLSTNFRNSDLTAKPVSALLPMTGNAVAVVIPAPYNYAVGQLQVRPDGTLFYGLLASEEVKGWDMGYWNLFYTRYQTENLLHPSADGYIFSYQDKIVSVSRGEVDLTADNEQEAFERYKAAAVRTMAKDTGAANASERYAPLASADGHTFWFYQTRKGFYTRRLGDDLSWGVPSAPMLPNAPAMSQASTFAVHPERGMLVRATGMEHDYTIDSSAYDQLSAYKDGQWSRHGLSMTANALAEATYGTHGVAVDPLNPDWVYGTTQLHGLSRMNLSDPEDLLVLGRRGDGIASKTPGFIAVMEPQDAWGALCYFSEPRFDAAGNLWAAFDRIFDVNDPSSYAELWCWTPEQRLASANAARDHSQLVRPTVLKVPGFAAYHYVQLLPLRAPGHENVLVFDPGFIYSGTRAPFIIDHRGTIDDPTDDIVVPLLPMIAENGITLDPTHSYDILEDPSTGHVWLMTEQGPVVIDVDRALAGKNVPAMLTVGGQRMEGLLVRDALVDSRGRKWLGTEDSGVVVISADNSRIEHYFSAGATPLPSQRILGFGEGADGSIWIGTDCGIAQYFPDGIGAADAVTGGIRIYPAEVQPDFTGHVTVSGLAAGANYTLAGGPAPLEIRADSEGRAQFSPRSLGLQPGRYMLNDSHGNELADMIIL